MTSSLLQQTVPPRWVARAVPDDGAAAALASALSLPPVVCRLLSLRGFTDAEIAKRYLKPRLDELHDPFALAGMSAAVERIASAMRFATANASSFMAITMSTASAPPPSSHEFFA